MSLSVAFVASLGALLAGLAIGGVAGFAGGRLETALMAIADFVLVLPAIYVVLALRAAMPLVLSVPQVFWTLGLVLAAAGWPLVARGVRGIIAAERQKEYVEAAYSMGASHCAFCYVTSAATTGFLLSIETMMVPAFVCRKRSRSWGSDFPFLQVGRHARDAWRGHSLTRPG